MPNTQDNDTALLKVMIAWFGTMLGDVTLSGLVLTATLIYTLLQIVTLVRKLIKGTA